MNTGQLTPVEQRLEAERLLATARSANQRARAHLIAGVLCEHERDWEGAIAAYRRCLDEEPDDPHNLYFGNNNLGFALIQLGRYDEAEGYCLAAIDADEDRHNAHKNLGLALIGQGRLLDGAFSLLAATRLQPADPRAWQHLEQLLSRHPRLLAQSPAFKAGVDDLRQMLAGGRAPAVH